jgi:protein-S-isoprenylcysteine O-methyltransferase Ste14
MDRTARLSKRQQALLAALLGLAIFAPLLLQPNSSAPWAPTWLGPVVAFAGLAGALLVFRQTGALRTKFLVLFFAGVGVAAACGALVGHT